MTARDLVESFLQGDKDSLYVLLDSLEENGYAKESLDAIRFGSLKDRLIELFKFLGPVELKKVQYPYPVWIHQYDFLTVSFPGIKGIVFDSSGTRVERVWLDLQNELDFVGGAEEGRDAIIENPLRPSSIVIKPIESARSIDSWGNLRTNLDPLVLMGVRYDSNNEFYIHLGGVGNSFWNENGLPMSIDYEDDASYEAQLPEEFVNRCKHLLKNARKLAIQKIEFLNSLSEPRFTKNAQTETFVMRDLRLRIRKLLN